VSIVSAQLVSHSDCTRQSIGYTLYPKRLTSEYLHARANLMHYFTAIVVEF